MSKNLKRKVSGLYDRPDASNLAFVNKIEENLNPSGVKLEPKKKTGKEDVLAKKDEELESADQEDGRPVIYEVIYFIKFNHYLK